MSYTLDEFCNDARADLKQENGPIGRECIARHLGPDKRSGAETIYADPEFDFRVTVHTNRGASKIRRTAIIHPG